MTPIPKNRIVYFFLIAVLCTAIDLISKNWVFQSLGYPSQNSSWHYSFFNNSITFQLRTSFNQGALWGIGQNMTAIFALLSCFAVVGILYWLFWYGAAKSLWLTVSLAFVTSGALGNLYDRLGLPGCIVDGKPVYAVRDFLWFRFGSYNWPLFNMADAFLVTGAIMLIFASFLFPSEIESLIQKKRSTSEK